MDSTQVKLVTERYKALHDLMSDITALERSMEYLAEQVYRGECLDALADALQEARAVYWPLWREEVRKHGE
jgi:hypothetical protein